MDENPDKYPQPDDDVRTVLEKLIAGFQGGYIQSVTIRLQMRDGTEEDHQLGYTDDAEKDAALARLKKLLNELH